MLFFYHSPVFTSAGSVGSALRHLGFNLYLAWSFRLKRGLFVLSQRDSCLLRFFHGLFNLHQPSPSISMADQPNLLPDPSVLLNRSKAQSRILLASRVGTDSGTCPGTWPRFVMPLVSRTGEDNLLYCIHMFEPDYGFPLVKPALRSA